MRRRREAARGEGAQLRRHRMQMKTICRCAPSPTVNAPAGEERHVVAHVEAARVHATRADATHPEFPPISLREADFPSPRHLQLGFQLIARRFRVQFPRGGDGKLEMDGFPHVAAHGAVHGFPRAVVSVSADVADELVDGEEGGVVWSGVGVGGWVGGWINGWIGGWVGG